VNICLTNQLMCSLIISISTEAVTIAGSKELMQDEIIRLTSQLEGIANGLRSSHGRRKD